MKAWLKRVLPALSAATALAVSGVGGGVSAAATGSTGGADDPSAPASAATVNPWIAESGLPPGVARQLQQQIDEQIAAYGGTQISPYEVSYNGGNAIMVFANPLTGEFPTNPADRAEAHRPAPRNAPGVSPQLTAATTSYRYGCPYNATSGWTCFYQNIDFNNYSCPGGGGCGDGGRMLQFESCGTQSLATYGFSRQTTSWVNNTSAYVAVYDSSENPLWDESPGSADAYVGSTANDKADNFWLIC
jgi:hypothetical protein